MLRKPRNSNLAAAKAARDDLVASRERLNQTSVDFLRVDVETALTFCDIARETRDPRKKIRNRQHARQGYDTILHLIRKVTLTRDESQFLDENLAKLKTQLVALGEAF